MSTTATLPRPHVAPPRVWRFPAGRTLQLSNGLTVVAYDLPGKQIAALSLLLDLGQEREAAGLEGLSNITVSALAEGTASYDAQGFAAATNRIGATYQANADSNVGTVSMSAPVVKIGAALDLLAEAVLRPTFPAAEVERLVKQRLDGIVNEMANPASRATLELANAFYATGTRRALPRGGTAESVARITAEAVQAHYLRQVDPATTTLVLAGDFSDADVEQLVDERFGEWISVGRTTAPVPAAKLAGGPQVVVVDRPGSVQTQLMLAAPSVPMGHGDLPSVMVSAYALGGGMESRIMAVLREEKGYTYGISAQAQSERGDGRFVVGGAVQTEVTGPAVEDLMTILRGYAEGGIQESERVTAVENLAGRAPLQYERPQAVANTAAQILANGLPDTHVDDQIAALRSTTVARVNEAFATGVSLDEAVLVAVGDGAAITEALGTAGLGDVRVVSA